MDKRAADLEVHLLDTPHGPVEWYGREPRDRQAQGSIVLVHGIQSTAASWHKVADHLDGPRQIIIPNLRGRGRSLRAANLAGYALPRFADDLAAILAMAPKPIMLVGWSMGVLVTLATLERDGTEGLSHLVLASGTPCPAGEAMWFKAQTPDELLIEAEARATRLALVESADPLAVAGAWLSVRDCNLEAALPHIHVPTLVLHGEKDNESPPAHGRRIAALIPGARHEAWAGAGHHLMAHDPRRLAQTLQHFYTYEDSYTIVTSQ